VKAAYSFDEQALFGSSEGENSTPADQLAVPCHSMIASLERQGLLRSTNELANRVSVAKDTHSLGMLGPIPKYAGYIHQSVIFCHPL
jgi:hypothetical protein